MSVHWSGFRLGRLSVCWRDLWERKWGLEVAWGQRVILSVGFGRRKEVGEDMDQ